MVFNKERPFPGFPVEIIEPLDHDFRHMVICFTTPGLKSLYMPNWSCKDQRLAGLVVI